MTDLKEMFRGVESMPAPDLWDEARIRSARHDDPGRAAGARSRTPAAVVALVAAGLAFLLLVRVFGSTGPANVTARGPAGTLAFESGGDVFVVQAGSSDVERLLDLHSRGSEGSLAFAWSPDGSMVAFTDEDANGRRRAFVAAADGSGVRAFTPAALDVGDLSWSPDGERIAFAASAGGASDIYAADVDGIGIQKLTSVAQNGVDGASMPAWSPDGVHIAFVWARYDRMTRTEDQTIAIIGANGGTPQVATKGPLDELPGWSASGNQIAFLSKTDQGAALNVVDPTTGTERNVANIAPGDGFAWSPIEDELAFLDAGTGSVLIGAPDGNLREVATGPAFGGRRPSGSVSWTLDGHWIGVAARSDSGGSQIFAVPVAGGAPIPVTSPELPAHGPQWRPSNQATNASTPSASSTQACATGGVNTFFQCPESRWAKQVATAAGYVVTGRTGSAYTVSGHGAGFFFWGFPTSEERSSSDLVGYRVVETVDSVTVYTDGVRFHWRIHGLSLWVEAGPNQSDRVTAVTLRPLLISSANIPFAGT
jgi:Tol biopolymer transport system component